jgi:dGTPase
LSDECRRYFTIRCIIDSQVKDVVTTTERRIRDAGVRSADDVRLCPKPLVQYSPARRRRNLELREYLYANLYFNPVVHEPNLRAVQMLAELFHFYLEHPKEIGAQSRKRVRKTGLHRAVCDYIAGMTDRYVIQAHQRLFGLELAPKGLA